MTYNLTYIENVTGVVPLITGINSNSDGLFGPALIFTLYLAILISFNKYGWSEAFAGASFITTLLASILWFMGALATWVMPICIVLTCVGLFVMYWGRN